MIAAHVDQRHDRPILAAPLFEELDGKLLELLDSLSPDEWRLPTVVPRWTVKQVAAHLLDTALRRLSLARDREPAPPVAVASDRDLAAFVNGLNAKGVEIYGSLSPRVLVALTRVAVTELRDYLTSLDPMAPAPWAVSWAGDTRSANWFDIARELTERWHHQQQIRLAVGRPGIMTPRLYRPVLECFLRALPHAYRCVPAPSGTICRVEIAGDCGGDWSIRRDDDGWSFTPPGDRSSAAAVVTIPQELAWRIFTRSLSPAEARPHVRITGDERLGAAVLDMIAIVA